MSKKLTNREIVNIYNSLDFLDDLSGSKFLFALDINVSRMENVIKSLNKSIKPSEKYTDFEIKKQNINIKYSLKDKNKEPVKKKIENSQYRYMIDPELIEEYQKEMENLLKDYEQVINDRNKQLKEYKELLDTENDFFVPHEIPTSYLPENITWEQYKVIRSLIKKEE